MSDGLEQKLIERAVELWCRALKRPRFDNGDDSVHGGFTAALAQSRMSDALHNTVDIDSKIAEFKAELTRTLLARNEQGDKRFTWGYLSTDYGPDEHLAAAADAVGLSRKLFSVKSSVIVQGRYVESSFGYGALAFNHYPLDCGGWLVTTLRGSDSEMALVIASVSNGNPLGLTVEPAQVTS